MKYGIVLMLSLVSIAVLFVLTKLMGNKQISQMSMFDYIVGITIGSIAAEMATDLENPGHALLAMVVYGITAYLCSYLSQKMPKLRHFLTGKPIVLFENGKLIRKNFKKARLDLNDFLTLCRVAGYFQLSDVNLCILEPTGGVSFLPSAAARPATAADVGAKPPKPLPTTVILDGQILYQNLDRAGWSKSELLRELAVQNKSLQSVMLGQISGQTLSLY